MCHDLIVKTAVLGGKGLFGHRLCESLVAAGHEVVSVRPRRQGSVASPYRGVTYSAVDVTDDEAVITQVLRGVDALVYGVGVSGVGPVEGGDAVEWVRDVVGRTFRAAAAAGVEQVVVIGSYLAAWERANPGLGIADRHPYVRARVAEADFAIEVGTELGMRVCVLEIPYVFGAGSGERHHWREILLDRLRGPVVLFPTGGTSVITTQQLVDAVMSALQRGEHAARYPLTDMDLTWREMISVVMDALGQRSPIMGVPRWVAQPICVRVIRRLQRHGQLRGLSAEHVLDDFLCSHIYVDATWSRELLRYRPGGVPQAIRDESLDAYGLPVESPRPVPQFAGRRH